MYMHTHMHVAYSPAASQFARFIASRHVGPNAERARVRKRVTGCGLGLYAFVTLRWAVTVWLVVWWWTGGTADTGRTVPLIASLTARVVCVIGWVSGFRLAPARLFGFLHFVSRAS